MKIITVILILVVTLFTELVTAQTTFQKIYSNPFHGGARSIKKTLDGGYILTGSANTTSLLKLDSSMNAIWFKNYQGSSQLWGQEARQTNDGGYIVQCDYGGNPVSLIKTNSIGDTLWTKSYSGCNGSNLTLLLTDDNGYIVTCGSNSRVIKLDSIGNLIWSRKYTYSFQNPYGATISKTNDGGLILGGSLLYMPYQMASLLTKLDSSGNTLWNKIIDVPGIDLTSTVKQTSDGGYILGGTNAPIGGTRDGYILKTDSSGNFVWAKTFGDATEDEDILEIIETTDGGFIVLGGTFGFGINYRAYVAKFDGAGNIMWSKIYGNDGSQAFDVLQLSNDIILVAGYDNYNGFAEYWLTQIDSNGFSGCNEFTPATLVATPVVQMLSLSIGIDTSQSGITISPFSPVVSSLVLQLTTLCPVNIEELNVSTFYIFPNPFTSNVSISFEKQNFKQATFEIKDILGRTVFRKKENNLNNRYEKTIDLSFLSSGIYLFDVNVDGERTVKKIVKE